MPFVDHTAKLSVDPMVDLLTDSLAGPWFAAALSSTLTLTLNLVSNPGLGKRQI